MKTVYVCGDSFATPDPEYGPMWVDRLAEQLGPDYLVVNTSSVGASNLLVAIQAEAAIPQADFIIVTATSCTRHEALINPATDLPLLDRFQHGELVSYSQLRLYRAGLPKLDHDRILDFHRRYDDLELNIFRDHLILVGLLHRLRESEVPFLFDQGGFEHTRFGGRPGYFTEFAKSISQYNLWDYSETQAERPYYHIDNPKVHQMIADYYATEITKQLNG